MQELECGLTIGVYVLKAPQKENSLPTEITIKILGSDSPINQAEIDCLIRRLEFSVDEGIHIATWCQHDKLFDCVLTRDETINLILDLQDAVETQDNT